MNPDLLAAKRRTAILIVEDDTAIQALLTAVLSVNYDLTVIGTGQEALNQMATGAFDLILLDVGLPDMDGFTVCRQLKSDTRTREVPVIFLTSRNSAQDEVKGLEAGGIDYIAKPINPAILWARVNKHVELKHSRDALSQMARLDGLTGLSNRRTFDDILDREWRRLARVGQHLSIIMFDVDHFKLYNDTYGHGPGDVCLKKIARCAVDALQRPADMVARYGGEEFVAVLPDTQVAGAEAVAQAIRENVAAQNIPHEKSPTAKHVTVSLGHIPKIGRPPTDLVTAADHALYEAKKTGRDRAVAGTFE